MVEFSKREISAESPRIDIFNDTFSSECKMFRHLILKSFAMVSELYYQSEEIISEKMILFFNIYLFKLESRGYIKIKWFFLNIISCCFEICEETSSIAQYTSHDECCGRKYRYFFFSLPCAVHQILIYINYPH